MVTESVKERTDAVENKKGCQQRREFCRRFLQTMDPERAGRDCGVDDPYELLESQAVQKKLSQARTYVDREIRREDVIRRLTELCFGRANDAIRLAFFTEIDEKTLEELELSAVSELKRAPNGGIEVKFLDRVKALSALYELLGGDGMGLSELYEALEETGEAEEP